MDVFINSNPNHRERFIRFRRGLSEMNVQRLHGNILPELKVALQGIPQNREVIIMIGQIDNIQEDLVNLVQEHLRIQQDRKQINIGNPIINSLGNDARVNLLRHGFIDSTYDLQNLTPDEFNETIRRITTSQSGFEAFNSDALRLAIAQKTWKNGKGHILRQGFYSANVDLSWRTEYHYQNGISRQIYTQLRNAINFAFGDVSFNGRVEDPRGGFFDLELGRNFASYLDNEQGHGHYNNRYSGIPERERKLFENIVHLMQQNQHTELKDDLRAIALNRYNNCPNEALGLIRQMILRTDSYFMNLQLRNLGENYLSVITDQVLTSVRMCVYEQSCFNLPGVRDAGMHGYGMENLRGYKFKLAPALNMPVNRDNQAAEYVRATTYSEVVDAIIPYLDLKFIREKAEPILSRLEAGQKSEFEQSVLNFNISFFDFDRIISSEENLIQENRRVNENDNVPIGGRFSLLNRINEFLNNTMHEEGEEENQARQKLRNWADGRISLTLRELRDSVTCLDVMYAHCRELPEIFPVDLENEREGSRYLAYTILISSRDSVLNKKLM